jgi:hypothetical protein
MHPYTPARLCDACNFGTLQDRCILCGGLGISDAYYCRECCLLQRDVNSPTFIYILIYFTYLYILSYISYIYLNSVNFHFFMYFNFLVALFMLNFVRFSFYYLFYFVFDLLLQLFSCFYCFNCSEKAVLKS